MPGHHRTGGLTRPYGIPCTWRGCCGELQAALVHPPKWSTETISTRAATRTNYLIFTTLCLVHERDDNT